MIMSAILWVRVSMKIRGGKAAMEFVTRGVERMDHLPRILAFDGGGVRGLSSLLILQEIMEDIRHRKKLDQTPKPCECFDLIGGTSTGGLIAIMLGLLGMTVEECLDAYLELSKRIFRVDNVILGKVPVGDNQCRFDYHILENSIKAIIKDRLKDEDRTLSAVPPVSHQVLPTFVVAHSAFNASAAPTIFRSYAGENVRPSKCPIWQAARATSAAPSFFKEIEIGTPPIPYIDGGLGHNNPSELALREAGELWPTSKYSCLVSIGTGRSKAVDLSAMSADGLEGQRSVFRKLTSVMPDLESMVPGWKTTKSFSRGVVSLLGMAGSLVSLVTNSEEVNRRLLMKSNESAFPYFRFNVERDVGDLGLEDWKRLKHIATHTAAYLEEPDIEQRKINCVKCLIESSDSNYLKRSRSASSEADDMGLKRRQGSSPGQHSLRSQVTKVSELALLVLQALHEYLVDFARAPPHSQELRDELETISEMLPHLRAALRENHGVRVPDNLLQEEFQAFRRMLVEMQNRMNKGKKGWAWKFVWPFDQTENTQYKEAIMRYKQIFIRALGDEQSLSYYEAGLTIGKLYMMSSLESKQCRKKRKKCIRPIQIDDKFKELSDWLCPPEIDPQEDQKFRRENIHTSGTGTWIFENPVYQKWACQPRSFLWLYGEMGSGKSMLTSSIISRLEEYCLKKRRVNAAATAVAYFYCDGNVQEKQDTRIILGSILKQLLNQTPLSFESQELNQIKDFFKQFKNRIFRTLSSVEIFLSHIIMISNLFMDVFIIVDGIDECKTREDGPGRKDTIYLLAALADDKIHTFISSRRQHDIEAAFSRREMLPMEISAVMSDIAEHIDSRLKWREGLMSLDLALKQQIRESLLRKCSGMFRWVECQLDIIARLPTRARKKQALNQLPDGLPETYIRMLKTIDPVVLDVAIKVFTWILYATGPLRLGDLAFAAAIEPDADLDEGLNDGEKLVPEEHVLQICMSFVKMNQLKVVEFTHVSVSQFFGSKEFRDKTENPYFIDEEHGHRLLTKSSIVYLLSSPIFKQGPCLTKSDVISRFQNPELFEYAVYKWPVHARRAETDKDVRRLILAFFQEPAYQGWLQLFASSDLRYETFHRFFLTPFLEFFPLDSNRYAQQPLYCAASLGLSQVVQDLIEAGADVNAPGGPLSYPLFAAANKGHAGTVKTLLSAGADTSLRLEDQGRTVLHVAVSANSDEVVDVLLNVRAETETRDNKGQTALHVAASNGSEKLVRLLLDHEAAIEALDNDGYTPLLQAVRHGHLTVVNILLIAGADVEKGDKDGLTAVHWAVRRVKYAVLEQLITSGAVIEKGDNIGLTALHWVAREGHYLMVDHLLRYGANVETEDKKEYTPLCWAAERGNHVVLERLLNNGANAQKQDKYGYMPLHRAAQRGHREVVRILLKSGVDVGKADKDGLTALHWAVQFRQSPEVVEMLVNQRADVNAQDNDGTTALHRAVLQWQNYSVIELLLAAGADVNKEDNDGFTALHRAAQHGYNEKVVEILLPATEDINKRDGAGYTALQWAMYGGHNKAVNILKAAIAGNNSVPNVVPETIQDRSYGHITVVEKDRYVGECHSDPCGSSVPHGFGTMTKANGDVYTGEFSEGIRHGYGTNSNANGTKFIGEYEKGKEIETQKLTPAASSNHLVYPNGDQYVGQVAINLHGNYLPHGYGTLTQPDGSTYKGYFYDGQPHGHGVSYHPATQRHYAGGFVQGHEEGYATITTPIPTGGQRQYVGGMVNDQRHGQGIQVETSIFGQIMKFEGQWANDALVGRGKFTLTESGVTHCYEGNFVNGRLEGLGIYSNSTYGISYKAVFEGGNVVQWSADI